MENPFDLDAFMADLEKNSRKPRSASDRLNRVLMNTRGNQGTLRMLPFISKKIGNMYFKLEHVREVKANTTLIDHEDPVWYRILPLTAYGDLTEKQIELYNEVTGLYDQLFDSDQLDYNEIRMRNYSMFTGTCIELTDRDDNKVEDYDGIPCLFIYPSTNVIDAFNSAVHDKAVALGEKIKSFLQDIITPALTGRKGILQINYKKADVGYDAKVSLERNDEFKIYIDPNKEFTEDFASKFDDPLQCFLGWMYDDEHESYFNETAFNELKVQLKARIKELSGESAESPEPEHENKNTPDPMTQSEHKPEMPPVPGVDQAEAPKDKPQRPF